MDLFDPAGPAKQQTLDEYIAKLQALREMYGGDIPVNRWSPAKARHSAPDPYLAFTKKIPVGPKVMHSIPAFWQQGFDAPNEKGDPVIRV